MKRFHVHLHVADIGQSVGFYSKLFAAVPARLETDYAKWMLQDPPVNFAISPRGNKAGIDHLGFQTDDVAELAALQARAAAADLALQVEGESTCCYARSAKHWITDPQGLAWEHFHTLADIPVFSEAQAVAPAAPATVAVSGRVAGADMAVPVGASAAPAPCCSPAARGLSIASDVKAALACC